MLIPGGCDRSYGKFWMMETIGMLALYYRQMQRFWLSVEPLANKQFDV
jgi:hypothetical protein